MTEVIHFRHLHTSPELIGSDFIKPGCDFSPGTLMILPLSINIYRNYCQPVDKRNSYERLYLPKKLKDTKKKTTHKKINRKCQNVAFAG